MKTRIENTAGCSRTISIEVSGEELNPQFDRVYAQIGKTARIPGFRPGHAPRDLLETHYGQKAEEEVVKRAIPEYYLRAVKEEKLTPVLPPEIENVRFKNHALSFNAKLDIKPQVKLKANYRDLKLIRKKIEIEKSRIDAALENLRESSLPAPNLARQAGAKEKTNPVRNKAPELNDAFAKDLGFQTLDELRQAIKKSLQANAEIEVKAHMEGQLLTQLLKMASLDIPQSLVNSQKQQLLQQLKLNHSLQAEEKEALESKEKKLEAEAGKEAVRRVKLSFILEEIAQRENIQLKEEDLEKRVEVIAQRSGKTKDEIKQYLVQQNLIPGLKAELIDKKTIEFLLNKAQIHETN